MQPEDPLQHLSRAAGLAAYTLLWLDMCMGLALTSGFKVRLLPRWQLGDLHQFTGLLSLGLLIAHIGVLVGLQQQRFTLPELLIPLLRHANWLAPVLGITALYLSILVAIISHARRYVPLRLWRLIHTLSFVAFLVALAHARVAGPDATQAWVRALYISTVSVLIALTAQRLTRRGNLRRAHRRAERRDEDSAQSGLLALAQVPSGTTTADCIDRSRLPRELPAPLADF